VINEVFKASTCGCSEHIVQDVKKILSNVKMCSERHQNVGVSFVGCLEHHQENVQSIFYMVFKAPSKEYSERLQEGVQSSFCKVLRMSSRECSEHVLQGIIVPWKECSECFQVDVHNTFKRASRYPSAKFPDPLLQSVQSIFKRVFRATFNSCLERFQVFTTLF
jgi:hypothetical protein